MSKGSRILVAEDEPTLAFAIQLSLRRAGFEVAVAEDGCEAWDMLRKEAFDLLMTDHQMPKMTGFELCLRVWQDPQLAQLPIIILTGKEVDFGSEQRPERPDCFQIIPKPFSPRNVVAAVKHLLQVSAASGPVSTSAC